jgi:hypothetical protein
MLRLRISHGWAIVIAYVAALVASALAIWHAYLRLR